ncbi:glycosyl hydrolase family 28-related protein [Peribacillus sp. SCS-26]|uniref:glycosyl hydrolase family 28-related protein n=1 Tax=Paraperibacillus marinus TaxID=3115295 RepID=UPI00390644B0
MIFLDKQHDPKGNRELIARFTGSIDMVEAVRETDDLFESRKSGSEPFHYKIGGFKGLLKRFLLIKKAELLDARRGDTIVDKEGNPWPFWKGKLDGAMDSLHSQVSREASVKDYGAFGDGVTDDTEAFRRAIGNGRARVKIPQGIYIVKGIKLPSWTILEGEGKGMTTLKLHENAPKSEWVITNKHHFTGNRCILVQNMSLDWNVERIPAGRKTAAGNNRSSCLTYANVKYGWVKNVEAINAGLHAFDVSSAVYTYLGDGTRARKGSSYIWLDGLNGYGFGDDGVTTHHSDNILISNSHMCDPSGRAHKRGFSNSNGFEVDDGSRNVWLVNNSSTRCFGGVEIKAHHNSAAASNVYITGHISIHDNRSYNFRHIGHHKLEDPKSLTAYNIRAACLVAIAPVRTSLYEDSKARGMVVSGYTNVTVNHFRLIGDPAYNYREEPVIAVQYRARNVTFKNIALEGFKTAGHYIKIFGGPQRADSVALMDVKLDTDEADAVYAGSDLEDIQIGNITKAGSGTSFG